ncbi:peptidoglycan-binding protein [Streptomyces sp. NPDC088387]|uniref:peptidoglycan-binding protein n=1 Tax=Streptomyces sp. NPDC088387 TaxID=3365859 RepID=UPI0037FE89D7
MSRWKELPAELDPRVRQLITRLRRLKDHSGLSVRQLAAKTGYSAKSWERYLGGRALPPREAVEAIAPIGDEDPTKLLALHEVAAVAWDDARRTAAASDTDSAGVTHVTDVTGPAPPVAGAEDGPSPGRAPGLALMAGAVALAVVVAVSVVLIARFVMGDTGSVAAPRASGVAGAPESPSPSRPSYTCEFERVDGQWFAGNSRTGKTLVAYGHAGPDVAEVQCLLRRAGFATGDVDGIFGPLTQRAVKQVQNEADLVVDGIVGPHTWKALRA